LPEELLDRILYFTDDATIHALTLVSKTLNRIATPYLYTHITLTPSSLPYLRPLAVLLWTSTKHASLVQSFSVRKAYGQNLLPWPDHPGVDLEAVIRSQV
ncbi:hypothetical protein EK21DRAFT_26074, partial [Setomelanomma holmii]